MIQTAPDSSSSWLQVAPHALDGVIALAKQEEEECRSHLAHPKNF